jgi:hypothetical protein
MRRFVVVLGIVALWCGPLRASSAEAAEGSDIQVTVRVDVINLVDDLLRRAGELSVRVAGQDGIREEPPGRTQQRSGLRPPASSAGRPGRPRSRPSPRSGATPRRSEDRLAATPGAPALEPRPVAAPAVTPPVGPVPPAGEATVGPPRRGRSAMGYAVAALGALLIPLGAVVGRRPNRHMSPT